MVEEVETSHEAASLEDVQAQLATVSSALSWPLNKVLEHFKPNDYMKWQLEEYLPEWGEKSLHDFLTFIKTPIDDGPDVLNGDMEPVNVFFVLGEFYGL